MYIPVYLHFAPLYTDYDFDATSGCEYRLDSFLVPYLVTAFYLTGIAISNALRHAISASV